MNMKMSEVQKVSGWSAVPQSARRVFEYLTPCTKVRAGSRRYRRSLMQKNTQMIGLESMAPQTWLGHPDVKVAPHVSLMRGMGKFRR